MDAVSNPVRQFVSLPARLLPSFTDLAFLLPVVFLFVRLRGAKTLLGDGDTGWHIRTGEWILSHHAIPRVDLFSFSKPGQPWFAWEWLWDIVFALIHGAWGLTGVVFTNVVLLGVISVLMFRLVRRQTENDVVAFAVTVLAIATSSIHWLARPHLAGWLLLLIFCTVLQRALEGNIRLLWLLPVITVVWTNVHGSFFIGVALLGVHALADALARYLWGAGMGRAGLLAFVAFLCALATFLNPYGIGLHRHVLSYLMDSKQLENIGEYQSVSFHAPVAAYFEIMLFLGLFAVCWCCRQKRVADALVLGAWAHLALLCSRNVAIFAFFAAPPVAGMIQDLARAAAMSSGTARFRKLAAAIRDLGLDHRGFERAWRFHLPPFLAVAVLAMLFVSPSRPDTLRAEYDSRNYPTAALKILESKPSSRIFADDEWGDYLIYRLYPGYRVFIDGRSDFYGAEAVGRMLDVVNGHYDWAATLSRYSIDTVLLRANAPLAGVLKESRLWSLIYDDGVATVFRLRQDREKPGPSPTYMQAGLPAHRPPSLN